MKQILQHLRTGELQVADLPSPVVQPGHVVIRSRYSLISAGTEKMLVEFSQANLLQKARQQPDKVKQVLDKIRTDGLLPTLEVVFNRLDEPLPLGYCNAGVVIEVGSGITDLKPGDRVASNGPHAEVVSVPRNLCEKVPDGVSDEQAAFTVLGSVALQGIRLAAPTFGEKFMVIGMGLLGHLTAQLLCAAGCEVIAVDLSDERLNLGKTYCSRLVNAASGGDPVKAANQWTGDLGVDGVIITASAKSDGIVHQAAQACRKRGRIILVGVTGLNLQRSDFYEKEISFQVSCSYGPGRYDDEYEQGGHDYPFGLVRWTERRNFEAVLSSMANGKLDVNGLISDTIPHQDAISAYNKIQKDSGVLGVLLQYPEQIEISTSLSIPGNRISPTAKVSVGVIGAGLFSKGVLLPALAKTDARLTYIADLNPAAAAHSAKKFGASQAITDYKAILDDPGINAVFVVVGHNLHARLVCEALKAGKHVYVEKPLALNRQQLDQVTEVVAQHPDQLLMVGFNRRFSPHVIKAKALLAQRSAPLCMTMTVNAGQIPANHWLHDPDRGGGRILGEGCHFIDLLSFLADSPVSTVSAMTMGGEGKIREDKTSILLGFEDGSIGVVNYFANGSKKYPKETLEIFSDGRVLRLDNFRKLTGFGFTRFSTYKTQKQDKGHRKEIARFIERVSSGGEHLITFDQLRNVTQATFAVVQSTQENKTVTI